MNRRLRVGFTIIEMIIVVAIIGILVAILTPALSGARTRAKKLKELHLMSQIGTAWTMYSGDHQDKLLEGYLSTKVQEYRELAWAFPDESLIPPAPLYTENMPNDAGPWTLRLLQYLDYDWKSLLFYRDTDEWTSGDLREYAEIISTEPAFGYNGFYIGGWWDMDIHSERPEVLFHSVGLSDGTRTNVVSRLVSSIPKPHQQIVFCTTFFAIEGTYDEMDDDIPGSSFAIPSMFARIQKWVPLPGDRIEARFDTYAPLGRFNGMPSICFADGSTNTVELQSLLNQQMWIPKARQIGDVPASKFTHTID